MAVLRYLLLMIFLSPTAIAAGGVSVSNAWINEAPPGAGVLAGYLTIVNNSVTDKELVDAGSEMFEKIEFHLTTMDSGVASMRRQDLINIPAGTTFRFEPGAYHLMLFRPLRQLQAGDIVTLELAFAGGENIQVDAVVKRGHTGHSH